MVPGEAKEGGAPQWPLSPRRTKGVPDTPGDDPEQRYLERGRAAMAASPNQVC